jgi:YVTN family beta-propeller protein
MRLRVSNLFAAVTLIVVASLAAGAQTITTQLSFTEPVQGVAVNPLTNQIFAVVTLGAGTSDALVVINGKTNAVTATIPIPNGAYVPAVDILTDRVFVATCTYRPVSCSVTVVDGFRDTVVTSIPVTTTSGDGLLGITANPLTGKVYVSNASDDVIDIINGYTNAITGKISLNGETPWGLTVNPDNFRLYVTLGGSQVDIIDTANNTILDTVSVGDNTYNAAVNWVTGNVFVTDATLGVTNVLHKNGNLLATVPVGEVPWGVDVDLITNLAFVANLGLDSVTVIDGKTNTATTTINGIPAQFVAVNPGTKNVYIAGGETLTVMTEQ